MAASTPGRDSASLRQGSTTVTGQLGMSTDVSSDDRHPSEMHPVTNQLHPRRSKWFGCRGDDVLGAAAARVLIADDDVVVRDVVRRYLERDGLEVLVTDNGTDALRMLGTDRIDVAVLDVMMP